MPCTYLKFLLLELEEIKRFFVNRFPKRFVGLGTLPMQAPSLAVKEMTRCIKDLKFPGVQIGSHINDWNLDAQELEIFWKVFSSSVL